jgi:alkanesulfonate monooxygenase SsuD/methylene tetrahydromethanopterin reductase-like flavin-dependent oxidoreductase (luciferase family)
VKFGIFNWAMWHETESTTDVVHNLVDEVVLADELGYHGYWIGEHHFTRHGIIGNTLQMAAYLAARTEQIRLGTAVIVLPLHNPVRVAEEAAMVDVLSNGRLDLGLGAGYQRLEYRNLGIDINEGRERFAEGLAIMREAWDKEHFSYQGKYYSWPEEDNLIITPRVVTPGGPPIYVALSASPATIDFAASHNLRLLVGGPSDLLGIAPQVIQRWRDGMTANGYDPTGVDIPCIKGIYVTPTDEDADADIATVDTLWDIKILEQVGSPISPSGEIPPGYEAWNMRQANRRAALEANTAGTARLVGSPETVRARIRDLQESGLTSLFGVHGFPGLPVSKIKRSIELFAKEVMPYFQSDQPAELIKSP